MKAFNTCAAEVCEGQQWDMEFEKTDIVTEAQYIKMIRQKTAVLLGFSLELGAILGDASIEERKALRDFGINIGIGFQLKDDLLDTYADPKKFGKQVGGDILANKKTFLMIKALEKSNSKQKKELEYWMGVKGKKNMKGKVNAVKEIYDALAVHKIAERKVNHYFSKGFNSIKKINPSINCEALTQYATALINRQV
jgi:geranylgeranyl diphosphate synthase type II